MPYKNKADQNKWRNAAYWRNPEEERKKANERYYSNKPRHMAIIKKWRNKLSKLVLGHYSNNKFICACCGDNRYCFLTLDHIVAIKIKAEKRERTHSLFVRLVAENFPSGYQVLCMNCNLVKSYKEFCNCNALIKKEKLPTWN